MQKTYIGWNVMDGALVRYHQFKNLKKKNDLGNDAKKKKKKKYLLVHCMKWLARQKFRRNTARVVTALCSEEHSFVLWCN